MTRWCQGYGLLSARDYPCGRIATHTVVNPRRMLLPWYACDEHAQAAHERGHDVTPIRDCGVECSDVEEQE